MIQELLGGGTAMEQLKGTSPGNPPTLPLVLQPVPSNPSPTSSSSTTSSRSSAQLQRSSATSSPQQQQQAEQAPLRCPRCNSSNTKFCYYNNYNLTQPRHFCKTCRRYWTKGGALRNVPIGGGCRKPRPVPAPAAAAVKQVSSCKAMGAPGAAPPLGLGVGVGVGMHAASPVPWASAPQATAQLMALLNSTRSVQGPGSNVHRLLGLDTMGHLQILPGVTNASGAAASLWPQPAPRPTPPPPPMDSQHGMGLVGHQDVLSGLGLKPSSSSASYYSDQLHAVVSNMGRHHMFDASTSLPCTTTAVSVPAAVSAFSVSAASGTACMEPAVSLAAPEMPYWSGPAMSVAWPDLPTPNGAFP